MDAVVTTLRTVSLFADLPREVLARLVSEFDELDVAAGQTVFSQGDPGDALYVVVSGAVEVRGERDGRSERVAVLGPGDCLGEMALVTGDPRSATVVTLSPTRLLRLDKERFQVLSDRQPVFFRELARVLCRRIARTSVDVAHARRAYTTVFDTILDGAEPPARRLLEVLAVAERADAGVLIATLGERPSDRGRGRRSPPGPGRPGRARPLRAPRRVPRPRPAAARRRERHRRHPRPPRRGRDGPRRRGSVDRGRAALAGRGPLGRGGARDPAGAGVQRSADGRGARDLARPPPGGRAPRRPTSVRPRRASSSGRDARTPRARSSSARSRDSGSTASRATGSCGASAPSTRSRAGPGGVGGRHGRRVSRRCRDG